MLLLFPFYLPWSNGTEWNDVSFFLCWVSSIRVSHCPLSPSSRGSLVPLHFLPLKTYPLHIWGCWYFSQNSWSQLMSHLAWHFVWWTLHVSYISRVVIYSLDILLSQFGTSVFLPCPVLTAASCPAYKFLRRQVWWSGIPIILRLFHNFLWSIQSKAFS